MDAQLARQKAEEERVASLHYEHLCRQQVLEGGRWHLKRKLRAEEITTNATGLVLAEEELMRVLDGRLEKNGIFIAFKPRNTWSILSWGLFLNFLLSLEPNFVDTL